MTDQDLIHLLALLKVDGVGDIMAKKLINHCGSAEAVFKAKTVQLAGIDGIGSVLLQKLKDKTVFDKAFCRTIIIRMYFCPFHKFIIFNS